MELAIAPRPRSSRGVDIVGFGVNTIDLLAVVGHYPEPDSKQALRSFTERPGGEAATAVAVCARLGWRSRYVGRFGNDERGRSARLALEREGVDLSGCATVHAPHAVSLILVDDEARRTVLCRRAAALEVAPSDVDPDIVASGRLLLVDAHQPAAAARAALAARRAGVPTVLDVDAPGSGLAAVLSAADVVVTSETFPEAFTGIRGVGAALEGLAREYVPALVCATLGREGSLALAGGREIRTPGFAVEAIDSTGAGDVFRGGLLSAWLEYGPRAQVEHLLTFANAVAALSCRRLGARDGIPNREEVDTLLAASGRR